MGLDETRVTSQDMGTGYRVDIGMRLMGVSWNFSGSSSR